MAAFAGVGPGLVGGYWVGDFGESHRWRMSPGRQGMARPAGLGVTPVLRVRDLGGVEGDGGRHPLPAAADSQCRRNIDVVSAIE